MDKHKRSKTMEFQNNNEEYGEDCNSPEQIKNEKEGLKTADKYIKNCIKFQIKIDPSVVIALQTRWAILQPSKQFNEGGLLPLMDILDENIHVVKLNLANSGMHDARFRSGG